MSLYYSPMAGIMTIIATYTYIQAAAVTLPRWKMMLVLASVYTLTVALWEFSPLPRHNGGYMSGSDDGRYWGWIRSEE